MNSIREFLYGLNAKELEIAKLLISKGENLQSSGMTEHSESLEMKVPAVDSAPLKQQVGGDHYKNLAIQPIEYCYRNNLGAIEGSVIKYVTRHKSKGGRTDIEKAIHLLNILLELEYDNAD